ncbi:hypothetical protein BV923_00735 [Pectobacterium odoriferum]|uniref:hypothetical protein n=1 Tax=Pectobacterium odoriferum TaxID=78398 RepID=UPI000CD1A3A0|nr:hypothetical protein [Pectobacterium odoriferum]POE24983.1 hypothetical protein BV923_00735 [Pectobacterium odoriferum]
MKYFRWEFLKRFVNITHLIAFSLGVIVICFLDAWVFEKSIADWVSASANTLMAGAALYAAFHAKDWLTPLKRNFSFNELVKCIKDIESILFELENTFKEVATHTQSDEETYIKKINKIDNISREISSIESNLIIIQGLGYKIDSNFIEEIKKIQSSVKKTKEILEEVQSISGHYEDNTREAIDATIKILNIATIFNEILDNYHSSKKVFRTSISDLLNS